MLLFSSWARGANFVLDCEVEDTRVHPLTGGATTLLDEQLNGDRDRCFEAASKSTAASMLVLLGQTNQLWICSLCRHEKDHQAMGSMESPNCTNCGLSIAATVIFYVVNWLRGLLTKSDFGTDKESDKSLCNFGQLAEHLLSPH